MSESEIRKLDEIEYKIKDKECWLKHGLSEQQKAKNEVFENPLFGLENFERYVIMNERTERELQELKEEKRKLLEKI
jgi:translation elongation factor EF-1beta